ncbi:MAG: hypothetical protein ACO1NS_11195 [Daejeonella sp.]
MLESLLKYEQEFFNKELDKEDSVAFRLTLKADLRQTYFHAMETFFELFFALNPKGKGSFDDEMIQFNLTHSNWQDTYRKIKEITEVETALDFLDEKIKFQKIEITIGHYLFYIGIFPTENTNSEIIDKIPESIEAIKHGIKIFAADFINREEYNAYKHGLRIVPSITRMMFVRADKMEEKLEFDLTDSMSFYTKTKHPDELRVVTKLFDSERDYQMTIFCSNLIHNIVFHRRAAMKFESDAEKFTEIPILLFGKESIELCHKVNVDVQDIVYTVKKNEVDFPS